MPLETPVPLTLFVTGDGYCDTLSLQVVVGEIRQCDPTPDGPRLPARYWAYDDIDTLYRHHPEFGWIEINGLGTRLALSDDQTIQIDLPSGFVWQYYGQQYTQISVCSNGWVAPGYTTSSSYTNTALPNSAMPPMVALCWDDLYPPTGNGVWYYHDAANHRFIVEYDSVRYYSGTAQDKFELVIHDQTSAPPNGDNILLAQYLTANGFTSATVGLQDPTLTVAIQCLFDNSYHRGTAPLAPGRAIKFVADDPTGIGAGPAPGNTAVRPLTASPNPFHGSVRFAASGLGTGLARVYDNNGRLTRSLTGTDRWTWDGRDDEGRPVAPGIYFCRVTSGSAEASAKVILR